MIISYSEFVRKLTKSGEQIASELSSENAHLIHMAMGISGEAGELLDAIKKAAIYNNPLDVANVIEELGDLEFYMEGLRDCLGINRNDVIQNNMDKLKKRYDNKYSDKAAQDRADKKGE